MRNATQSMLQLGLSIMKSKDHRSRGLLAADGGVLKNAIEDVVFAFHEFYDESCSNILEAELRTLLTGQKLCFENGNLFKFNIWAELDFIVGAR
ncbi:Hypothetical predicted protein [Olea europaea subsp. europaea]|uniref:Uncharacterized protein n=1 Tax=Olea europaea subsp. europaea TaxID=158383 RepID=A0A8S0U8N9_OLEEU|nr:Hypothetical predicted protein [Olea europaea subsp. europaea]